MSGPPSPFESTCSARTVDSAIRGAILGATWGAISHYSGTQSGSKRERRVALRSSVLRNATDCALFLTIYSGVQCAMIRHSGTSEGMASAMGGCAAGCFIGGKSGASGRVALAAGLFSGTLSYGVNTWQRMQRE